MADNGDGSKANPCMVGAALESLAVGLHPMVTGPRTRYLAPVARSMKAKHMKYKIISLALLTLAAVVAGCDQQKVTPPSAANPEARTAAQEIRDYTFAQKAEFTQRMKAQLAEINQDMDQLEAKIAQAKDEASMATQAKLKALREQSAQLNQQVAALNDATESTWDNVKSNTQKGYETLKEGVRQSRQWLSDKIAPTGETK